MSNILDLDVNLRFPGFELNVQETLDLDGVIALYGPSGAGKSTMLRVISGLEKDSYGTVKFKDSLWMDTSKRFFVPPYRRAIGMVFQEPFLFPHLRVAGNLNYGLRRRKLRQGPEYSNVVKALDLGPLLIRTVHDLSGGEKQRVALGRTLLSAPDLLLLDEPLAALDSSSKRDIMPYLARIIHEFRIPVIYVSHASEEIKQLANHVCLINAGKIIKRGSTSILQGFENRAFVYATVHDVLDCNLVLCRVGSTLLKAHLTTSPLSSESVVLALDTSRIIIMTQSVMGLVSAGKLPCRILEIVYEEKKWIIVHLASEGGKFPVKLHLETIGASELKVGQNVEIVLLTHPEIMAEQKLYS